MLLKKNTPNLFIWSQKGEIKHIGTPALCSWFEQLSKEEMCALNKKMTDDVVQFRTGSNSTDENNGGVDDNAIDAAYAKVMDSNFHSSGIPLLPCSLNAMSQKEKVSYISAMIRSEAKSKNSKVIYGSLELIPSFWLESLWSWTEVKQPLSSFRESTYTGSGTFSSFLSLTIERFISSHGLDCQTHVKEGMDLKKLNKKRRAIGVHSAAKLIEKKC